MQSGDTYEHQRRLASGEYVAPAVASLPEFDLELDNNPDLLANLPVPTVEIEDSYIVQKGDTLWDIAGEAYSQGDQWTRIADVNAIGDPTKLLPGQNIQIPAKIGVIDRNAQLASINQTPRLTDRDFQTFVEKNLVHQSITDLAGTTKSTLVPAELIAALREYADSPIGANVVGFAVETGRKVTFTQSQVPDSFFTDSHPGVTEIEYTLAGMDLTAGPRVPGDELESETLTSILAHEIGHTSLARTALDLPVLELVKTEVIPEPFQVIYKKLPYEELRATALFENPFRAWKGLPIRRSYVTENDVLHYNPNVGR